MKILTALLGLFKTPMIFSKKRRMMILRGPSKTSVFFSKDNYNPDKEEIKIILQGANLKNDCAGSNLGRFSHGEIEIFYNPLNNPFRERTILERELKDYIKTTSWTGQQ